MGQENQFEKNEIKENQLREFEVFRWKCPSCGNINEAGQRHCPCEFESGGCEVRGVK